MLKVGDKVIIVATPKDRKPSKFEDEVLLFLGKEGIVEQVDTTDDTAYVTVGDGIPFWFSLMNLAPAFKVGDRVRVRGDVKEPRYFFGDRGVTHNSVGVVAEVYYEGNDWGSAADIVIDFPEHPSWRGWMEEMELVPQESSPPMEVGDIVRIKDPGTPPPWPWESEMQDTIGKEGKVVCINSLGTALYEVEVQGDCWWYRACDIEAPSRSEEPSIQVGDKVRVKPEITDPTFGWGYTNPGEVGVVKSILSHAILVNFPSQTNWSAGSDELEKVEPWELKVGDRVRILPVSGGLPKGWVEDMLKEVGKQGVIRKVDPDPGDALPIGVHSDFSDEIWWYHPDQLAPAPDGAPREHIQYENLYDAKGRPTGVICRIVTSGGDTFIGVSRCNKAAGDTFYRKAGRQLARQRAEFARDTNTTAYFKNGGICMGREEG